MNKRVHQIAKEHGLAAKEVIERLNAAGIAVKAASSSVDEAAARRVLGDGNGAAQTSGSAPAKTAPRDGGGDGGRGRSGDAPAGARSDASARGRSEAPRARADAPAREAADRPPRSDGDAPARGGDNGPSGGETSHKRPTRDSLQGERAPGNAGGRRRVVIDSQASRRNTGGPPAQTNQPPRRQRRGRRRRGVYDDEAESRPSRTALAVPDAIGINSWSTVKDVAEYLDVPVPEIMKQLMALGEMKTLTQTLSDEAIQVLAAELGKTVEIVHSEDETIAEPVFDDAEETLVE
ncbi:MAG: translation initiation factor IF-2 N-terminal domain-containing protein, partial [Solirubrobacteraceae bacterium]